jgi:UDP-GlcNAc:undecaprenyl-phosphate GlcNAc-1-phosphate transferase
MFDRTELFGLVLPFPLNYIIIIIFIVGAINSVNLMDGLDGLVAGFSIQVAWMIIILASISYNQFLLIVSLALLGSIMGFLKYNAYPAKIFLGDTGSLSIGFFIVFAALYVPLGYSKGSLDLTFSVILLGVPVVDTLKVILVRLWQKKNPFHPDQNHLHHIIINGKIRHKTTVGFILLLSALFAMDSSVYLKFNKILGIAIFLFLSVCLLLMQYILPAIANIKSLVKTKNKIVDLSGKKFVTFYEFFLPLSLVNVFMLVLFLFPVSSQINIKGLDAFFISIIGMLFVSLFRRQNDQLKDIYVLFNFIIFFIISNFSVSFIGRSLFFHDIYKYEIFGSLILLSLFLAIFLFQREKFNAVGKVFLTGLDMTLIIVLISLYAFTIVMPSNRFKFIEINFWETIVLFLWYKMIVYFDNKFSIAVYYFSYALPVLAILSILIFSSH